MKDARCAVEVVFELGGVAKQASRPLPWRPVTLSQLFGATRRVKHKKDAVGCLTLLVKASGL